MKRDYEIGARDDVIFFVGTEVEHTPAYGTKTLFVVGVHDSNVIISTAKNHYCEHVYLGANQSFDPITEMANKDLHLYDVIDPWNKLALSLLEAGFLVTLDFDVKFVENVLEMTCNEHDNFIPQISIKIPYARQFNYNATVKIDDKGFKASNPGIWCHSLNSLLDHKVYTNWNAYKKDRPL